MNVMMNRIRLPKIVPETTYSEDGESETSNEEVQQGKPCVI
jgi:hypothetical protein